MWFKVDDHLHDHAKLRDLDLGAVGLWTLAGSWCGENGTDGFVPESVLRRWSARWKRLAGLLVERNLWATCTRGREVGYEFVNWFDYQPTRDETQLPLERLRWRRKQALKKDRDLCERIVARDRSRCRYCATRVNWKDRKGPLGGTYDHVDPDGENTLANVVVACRRCNGRKRDRTPEEAGMPLLPEPPPYTPGSGSEPDPDQIATRSESGSDLVPPARRTRDGSGQVGSGSEPGRSQLGARSGRDDSAPGPGPGRGPPPSPDDDPFPSDATNRDANPDREDPAA